MKLVRRTFATSKPSALAAIERAFSGSCTPVHTSARSPSIFAVHTIGSIVAWATNGARYSAVTTFAASAGISGGAPSDLSKAAKIDSVETSPCPASLNSGFNAASARRARQKLSATTATASSSFTILFTPGMASAGPVSTATSLPP